MYIRFIFTIKFYLLIVSFGVPLALIFLYLLAASLSCSSTNMFQLYFY